MWLVPTTAGFRMEVPLVAAIVRHRKAEVEQARRAGRSEDPAITASWDRCQDLVDTGLARAPMDLPASEAEATWASSPLRNCTVDLEAALADLAEAGALLGVVADEKCRVLWTNGPASLQRRSARIGLVVGAHWSELAIGTNAIALAAETGSPASVFAGEHWCAALGGFRGWAAPILGTNGGCRGVVALYGRWDAFHPTVPSALALLARLASEHLPDDQPAVEHHRIELSVLGTAHATWNGEPVALTPRQVEYLAILALEEVATLDQFRERVYGEQAISTSTIKAELSHLRHRFEGGIGSRPYRLTVPLRMDAMELRHRLMLGDLDGALALYRGPVLPRSDAPFARDYRHVIDVVLRSALLDRGTADQLLAFAAVHRFDEALYERVLAITAAGDPRRAEAAARLANARQG